MKLAGQQWPLGCCNGNDRQLVVRRGGKRLGNNRQLVVWEKSDGGMKLTGQQKPLFCCNGNGRQLVVKGERDWGTIGNCLCGGKSDSGMKLAGQQ